MPLAYILLGSNLGSREDYLQNASKAITDCCGSLVKKSAIYQTQAWGVTNQPSYLNQVIIINTSLQPQILLESLLQIEIEMGRERSAKYDSRTIDIDILFYGREIVAIPNLSIPHPQIQNRRFVLVPLCALVPHKIHPILKLPLKKLLQNCNDSLPVELYQ